MEDLTFGTGFTGSDGLPGLTPNEIGNSTGQRTESTESIDIDPGFNGSSPSLAAINRGRGFVFRRNLLTGADNGNAQITSPASANLRDLAFTPNGDTYFRAMNGVQFSDRLADFGGSGVAYAAQTVVVGVGAQDLAQMNVEYIPQLPFTDGPVVLYNSRASGANSIKVIRPDGSETGNIMGNENGIGDLFNNILLNFNYVTGMDGNAYLLVTKGGSVDRLDVYRVVPEPGFIAAALAGLGSLVALRRRKP